MNNYYNTSSEEFKEKKQGPKYCGKDKDEETGLNKSMFNSNMILSEKICGK